MVLYLTDRHMQEVVEVEAYNANSFSRVLKVFVYKRMMITRIKLLTIWP